MTEEETAEEYANKNVPIDAFGYRSLDDVHYDVKQAYLAGLIEGRKEKWHDLRKDPNDLPKHSGLYCVQSGEVREYVKEEKSWFTVHFDPCMNRTEETYLWCELTKFEE